MLKPSGFILILAILGALNPALTQASPKKTKLKKGVKIAKRAKANKAAKVSAARKPTVKAPTQSPAPAAASADALAASARNRVFPLLVGQKNGAPRITASAFVIDSKGLLLTNYDSLAELINNPGDRSAAIEVDGKLVPAELVSFDVTSNLALIRTARSFTDAYAFSSNDPDPSSLVHWVGRPTADKVPIFSGRPTDLAKSGLASRIVVVGDSEPALGGGPVLNASGQVVGVQDAPPSMRGQKVFRMIAGEPLRRFTRKAQTISREPASALNTGEIQRQVETDLSAWMQDWKKRQDSISPNKIDGMTLAAAPSGLNCAEGRSKPDRDGSVLHTIRCGTAVALKLDPQHDAGRIDLRYDFVNPRDGVKASASSADMRILSIMKASDGTVFEASGGRSELRYVCSHRFTKNASGVESLVEFCTRDIPSSPGMYDFFVASTPVRNRSAVLAEMVLHGFTPAAIRSATELFLNSVRSASL